MTTQIAVTADDYGLHASVNETIEALAEARAITSVSAMAHEGAVLTRRLRDLPVVVGAHLVFVEEPALLGKKLGPFVDDDGRLPRDYRALFSRIARHPRRAHLLRDEAEAQIIRLEQSGLRPAFLNSHQHTHLFPPLWRLLRPLFARIGAVRAVRVPARAPAKQLALDASSLASLASSPLSSSTRLLRPVGIDLAGRFDERVDLARFGRRLRRTARFSPDVLELVTHPGGDDHTLTALYPLWHYRWQSEARVLRSPAFAHMLARAGLTLTSPTSS